MLIYPSSIRNVPRDETPPNRTQYESVTPRRVRNRFFCSAINCAVVKNFELIVAAFDRIFTQPLTLPFADAPSHPIPRLLLPMPKRGSIEI